MGAFLNRLVRTFHKLAMSLGIDILARCVGAPPTAAALSSTEPVGLGRPRLRSLARHELYNSGTRRARERAQRHSAET